MSDFDDKALQSLNRFQIENADLQGELIAKNAEIAALRVLALKVLLHETLGIHDEAKSTARIKAELDK